MFRRRAGKIRRRPLQFQADFRNPADEFKIISASSGNVRQLRILDAADGELEGHQFSGVPHEIIQLRREFDRLRKEFHQERIGDPLSEGKEPRIVEQSRLIELPQPLPVRGEVAEGNIGEIGVPDLLRLHEHRIREKNKRLLKMGPQLRKTELLRHIVLRGHRERQMKTPAGRIDSAFAEKLLGVPDLLLKARLLLMLVLKRMILIQNSADHPAEHLPLGPEGPLDQGVDLAGAVCRAAGGVLRADVKGPERKLVLAGGGADMRKIPEAPDHKHHIAFAVHHRPFQREVHRRIGEAVDEVADVGRVERVRLLLRQSGEEGRLPRCVLSHADHHIAPLGVGHRDAVPDKFRLPRPREILPVLRRLVIQFIGFDSPADDGSPVRIVCSHVSSGFPNEVLYRFFFRKSRAGVEKVFYFS